MHKTFPKSFALMVSLLCACFGGLRAFAGIPGVTPPAHIVIVIEENHAYEQIINSSSAPYINSLTNQGVLLTQSFAIEHPSEPNYLDLFSGSNQGVTDDSCPHSFTSANLGGQLLQSNRTFVGYSEDLPSIGSTTCTSGGYARKHAPWVNWQGNGGNLIPSADNQPFSNFPTNFNQLPTVCIIDPNLNNDMHDGSISTGDTWLKNHLNAYAQWAKTNNSLLIVTWDEDENTHGNHIATLFVGEMVKKGGFDSEHTTHYGVLRTVEDLYGLPHIGNASSAKTITNLWLKTSSQADFTVTASPISQVVAPGDSTTYTVTISPTNGFTGTVALSVSGLPAGATASFSPASISGSGASTLTVTTSASTPGGSSTLTIKGTSGSLVHTTTASLVVMNFTISATPTSRTVNAGDNTNYTVNIGSLNGFNGTVSLSASGLPAGASAGFSPASVTAPGSAIMTVDTSSSTAPGSYAVTITGTSGSVVHSTGVTLVVTTTNTLTWTTVNDTAATYNTAWSYSTNRNLGDYNNDIHYTKTNGNYAQYTFTGTGVEYITETYTDEGNVDVYIDGVFQTTVSCNSTTRQSQVVAYSNTGLAAGSHTIKVVKNGGTYMLFDAFAYVAGAPVPNFTLSASPSSQTVTAGTGTSYTTTVGALNGFNGDVGLSVSGLPGGATGSFSPASITGSGSSTLTVSTSSSTPAGTYTLTITGTSGSIAHSTTVTLAVNSATATWTTVNDTAAGITFNTTWGYSTNRNLGDYNNDIHYAKTNGYY
ncbi:MAG TPA: alkaline phosphatase family protein, partial [Desulfuromonadaceae bacterium]|nr:alkaline phosphatase family protein [Desulfuromonadaceae bacterium]